MTHALTFAAFGVLQAAWGWELGGAGARPSIRPNRSQLAGLGEPNAAR